MRHIELSEKTTYHLNVLAMQITWFEDYNRRQSYRIIAKDLAKEGLTPPR